MTFHYDHDADALEIRLADGIVAHTIVIDSGTQVDVDEHGAALSIEVIRPARRVPVNEIIERFGLEHDDVEILRSLWAENVRLPFETAHELAVA